MARLPKVCKFLDHTTTDEVKGVDTIPYEDHMRRRWDLFGQDIIFLCQFVILGIILSIGCINLNVFGLFTWNVFGLCTWTFMIGCCLGVIVPNKK